MIRSYRYPLHSTPAVEAIFDEWLRACCALYNGALQERRAAWRAFGKEKRIGLFEQTKSLTEIRGADPAWAAIPVEVTRSALRRLDKAMKAFFGRCKRGATPGFPRFRSVRRYDSFGFQRPLKTENGRVFVPKVGWVKFHEYRPIGGKILDVIIRREADRWWIVFQCDMGAAPAKPLPSTIAADRAIGIDVGLKALATLSDGASIDHPRFAAKAAEQLARRQRSIARRKKGSKSRRRALLLVQKAHAHVKNQRLDFARKTADGLVARYDLIAYEDLNISRMVHGSMAYSIHDAGWRLLTAAIACKAESAGKHAVAVDPRGTSQRCSRCGATVPKGLRDRIHDCPHCGLVLDRDVNAAINIIALGRSAVSNADTASAKARS